MAMLNVDDFAATASLFPIKLYRMVCDTQCQCMNWGGEGEHLVLNTRLFEDELLQQTLARWKYQLKTTSTTSFIRQLHAYGFRKVVEGFGEPNNIRRYYHPYFHRNRPDLLMYMKRSIRSSNPKKVPIRIFEDANKQPVLMTSMFNHPIQTSPFEKMNFNFDANSHQIKMEESVQAMGESSNKRRRKAPPKKHPSFEDSCDWADEEGFSPPTMVTRSHQPHEHPAQIFAPLILKSGDFLSNQVIPMLKQESGKELVPFTKATPIDLMQPQLPSPALCEAQKQPPRVGENVTRSGKVFKKEKVEEGASEKSNQEQDAHLLGSQLGRVSKSDESEGPLDLSQPRMKSKKAVVVKAATPGPSVSSSNSLNLQQPKYTAAPFNPDESCPKNLLTYDGARCSSAFDQTMGHPRKFAPNNNSNKLTCFQMTGSRVPPSNFLFPSAPGGRLNVPPHSVLQPAYIAWPTRGIFCPQTKQWIQSRPTIIPLPFNNKDHQDQQLKGTPSRFKFAGENLPQFPWSAPEQMRQAMDMKEVSIKSEIPPGAAGIFSPLIRVPISKEL